MKKQLVGFVLLACLVLTVGSSMLRTVSTRSALGLSDSPEPVPLPQTIVNSFEGTHPDFFEAGLSGSLSLAEQIEAGSDLLPAGRLSSQKVENPERIMDPDEGAILQPDSGTRADTPTRPADAAWFTVGDQQSRTGESVSSAGDVNGDGYDDVIVGSTEYSHGDEKLVGGAFVWHGSAAGLGEISALADADWMAHGDQYFPQLGWSVGSAGDVNDDGYDDVIVGAYLYNTDLQNAGAAFVWYGSPTGLGETGNPDNADWAVYGNQTSLFLGYSVGSAGDVNGDGAGDIIVGAYNYSTEPDNRRGAAFVWHGSPTGLGPTGTPANADWMAVSDQDYSTFGESVGTAGDVNGDGYDDVIVGSVHYASDQYSYAGAAWVWHGSSTGLGPDATSADADWTAIGEHQSTAFGESVSTAGDVNGDGYDEVVVGARSYLDGAVFVWYGSASGLGEDSSPSDADWSTESDTTGAWLGASVNTAGDVNSDGYDDIIAGAPFFQPDWNYEPADPGAAYIWYGSPIGLFPASSAWAIEAEVDKDLNLGYSVGTAGDVNGDGAADIIVGAPRYPDDTTTGAAFVFHGESQPHFLLHVAGPTTAAPGQTVDYAIFYLNALSQTVESAVLVLSLPSGSEYVESTAGGIFWPKRHQVFWKLGDLAPGAAGELSARGRIEWGLSNGTPINAHARLAGANWGQSGVDVNPYLEFEPRELLGSTPLTDGELLSELASYPDLATIYSQAIDGGFVLGEAVILTITNQAPITQVTLLQEERSEVMDIRRESESIQAAIFGPTFYEIRDATGGMILDYQLDTLSYWGSWLGSSFDANFQTACSLTTSECIFNCITDKLPSWALKNMSKSLSLVSGGYDCIKGLAGNDTSFAKCLLKMAKKKGLGELVDTKECYDACSADPLAFTCNKDRSYCDRDITNPLVIAGIVDSIKTLHCEDNCKYKWPAVPRYSAQWEVCKECPEGPVFLKPDECCGGTCDNQSSLACLTSQESCTTCATSECEVQPAQDPNAKYGTEGDVLPGQTLTYTITYENVGSGQAFGVFVVDELDEDLDDSTLTVNSGEYISSTRTIIWDIGELAPAGETGSSGAVTFTVAVSQGLPGGTVISNEAMVHFPSAAEQTPTGAVVNIVQPVVAIPQHVETTYARPVSITLVGKDVSEATLTYLITEDPSYGELTGIPPNLTYTPMEHFTGPDRFSFTVDNGTAESRPADVTIMVLPSADDETAPQVLWTSPGEGETIAHPAAPPIIPDTGEPVYPPGLLVRFSESLDPTTVTAANIYVEAQSGDNINVTPVYNEWSNWLNIVLHEPWQAGEYTVTLTTGLKDASGNALVADYTWSFTVAASDNNIYIPLVAK